VEGDEGAEKELMKNERATTKFWAGAIRHAPAVTDLVTKAVVGAVKFLLSRHWILSYVDKKIREEDAEDLKKVEDKKKMDGIKVDENKGDRERMDEEGIPGPGYQLALAFNETFHQGTAATMQEATILFSPWGFDVATITYDKIQVWHGTKDINAPLHQIQYVVDRLPHCELKTYDADHFELVKHIEDIIGELITDKVRQQ
jgi:hypothetical protein